MEFTPLEKAILKWIAERCDNEPIRQQIFAAYPTERELTGTGSFTKLALAPHIPRFDGFLVDGKIDTLEIYSFGDKFDPHLKSWKLS